MDGILNTSTTLIVSLLIWIGLTIYFIYIDRRLVRLEKKKTENAFFGKEERQ